MFFKIEHFYKQTRLNRLIAVAALFALPMLVVNCTTWRDAGEKIPPTKLESPKEQKTMQINIEKINCVVPKNFMIAAGGAFYTPDESGKTDESVKLGITTRQEYLTVSGELPLPEGGTIETVMKEARERPFNTSYAADFTIEREEPATVDGHPARLLIYTVDGEKVKYRNYYAVIQAAAQTYITLMYQTLAEDAASRTKFNHILTSAAFTVGETAPTTKAAAPSFTRRFAGRLSLDVPDALRPAKTDERGGVNFLQNTNQNPDAQIALQITFYDAGQTPQRPLDSEIEQDETYGAAIASKDVRQIKTDEFEGRVESYVMSRGDVIMPAKQTPFLLAEGKLRDGTLVRLRGKSPISSKEQMQSSFNELLESVRPVKGAVNE